MATNPFDAAARQLAHDDAGSALYQTQDADPEKVARANQAARVLGLPADLIEADLPAMEQRVRMAQARSAMANDPRLAAWASNPRNASIAADDFQNLKRVQEAHEKAYGGPVVTNIPQPKPTFGNFFRGVWANLAEATTQTKESLTLLGSDLLPDFNLNSGGSGQTGFNAQLRENIRQSQMRQQASDPAFKSRTMRGFYSGVSSTVQMVPGIAAGVFGGVPAGIAAIAAPVGVQAYGKYRVRGASPGMAAVGGIGEGSVEAATEALPMGFIVGRFGKVGFAPFVAGLLGREVPSEQVATFAQDAIDTAIANPDKTWGDFLRERPDAQYETLIATLVPSLLLGGAEAVAHRHLEAKQAGDGERDAGFLDDIAKVAEVSKVRQRDPSAFADFLEKQLDGSQAENLYIPAEKVRELYQSNDVDWHSPDDPLFGYDPGIGEQIDQALAMGGDVVVKAADFAAHLAGTPAWEALKDHVRASPGGMSRSEAQEWHGAFEDAMRQSGEELAAQMESDRVAMEPRQKLAERMRDKLMLAGFRPDTAMQYAELTAARYATRAERLGLELTGEETEKIEVSAEDLEGADLSFEQSDMGGKRGKIAFKQGKAVISLFESRNLSTLPHEFGHLFLEELKSDAQSRVSPKLTADFETVRKWFRSQGIRLPKNGSIPTEAHELWARGFERFLMEGKAPSTALRRAFDAFRRWLISIYRAVDNLRSPISPEIRGVMERLIATDAEIQAARAEQNIDALFTSAVDAGMTDAEFAEYRRLAEESRNEAHDALLYRTMSAVRQAHTKAWKAEEATVRAEVTERVDRQPIFRAMINLTGEMKIDRQWLIDTYGEDILDHLPKRVPPIYRNINTTHPDIIAEMSGFASGDVMIHELMGLEQAHQALREAGDKRTVRQVQIDAETQQIMLDRHGDALNDGTIEEEARALIHNDKQGEVIASEIRSLARRSNKRPTPYIIAKRWAAERIAASTVVESTSGAALQRYERAARKAAKASEEAMLKGDVEETYRQKQAQMLNNALIAEAWKAKEQVDAAVRRLSKIARRKTSPSIDQDYLEQAQGLLEQVEFRSRSQSDIERQASFEEWARAQRAAGHDIVVPDSFGASLGTTHWSRLSVEKLLGLDETVQQIIHLGRLKQKLIDAKEERDYAEVIAEAIAAVGNLPPKTPSDLMDPSWRERFKAGVANADAALLKMETIIDWLDNNNPDGVFNRIVFKPMAEAQARESDVFADYTMRLTEAMAQVPKKQLAKWGDHISIAALINRETGNPFTFSRHQLISMALNMGNEGNAQRLADGYGWNEATILHALNDNLTQDEWRYVQKVWDILDGLWPDIQAMERRVNGVAPEKVTARPLETSAGTLAGGYYPAVYDSARDYSVERNQGKEGDLFEAQYTRATTRASSTRERTDKVSRPILLDLGVISRHVGEVIHDITHREAVMNADKFLSDTRIMKAVDQTLGPAARKQFRPWLKFVANQWAIEKAGNEGIGAFMNKLRSNTTVVGMGFRVSTIMMQIAGYSNSFEVVGSRWVTPAIAQTLMHPVDTFNFVMERSGEIRHRMDTLDRDIAQGIKKLAGKTNPLTEVKRFAFHGIGYMDRIVVIPTWIGAYNKALAGGAIEDAAVYAADKAVRQSQGSAGAKDMAAVMRGTGQWGQALKLMTMFYSYVSAVYQRQRTFGRDMRQASAKDIPSLMARAWWLIVVPPILSELLAGRGPDEDEDWAAWAVKLMIFQGLGAIPLVRDVARPLWDRLAGNQGFGYRLSPIQGAFETFINVGGDINKIAEGEDTTRATRNALETAGYFTGLVPGQVAAAVQFLVDVGYDEQDPETVGDWYEGLTTGRIKTE